MDYKSEVRLSPNNGKFDLWIGNQKVLTFVTIREVMKYLEEISD